MAKNSYRIIDEVSKLDWKKYWEGYWSDKTSGGHRKNTEEFLQKESREKLFHLKGGESLLDFGCGSADLLVYYADYYKNITGADISPSMIQKAEDRLNDFNKRNVDLIVSDEKKLWG